MKEERPHWNLNDEHRHWLRQFAATIRTQYDFLLAQRRDDPDIYRYAGQVLVQLDGRFVTIRALVDACGAHNWNRMIYEAWAWETAQRIRSIEHTLDAIEAAALRVYASEYYDCDDDSMLTALREAQSALEGAADHEEYFYIDDYPD